MRNARSWSRKYAIASTLTTTSKASLPRASWMSATSNRCVGKRSRAGSIAPSDRSQPEYGPERCELLGEPARAATELAGCEAARRIVRTPPRQLLARAPWAASAGRSHPDGGVPCSTRSQKDVSEFDIRSLRPHAGCQLSPQRRARPTVVDPWGRSRRRRRGASRIYLATGGRGPRSSHERRSRHRYASHSGRGRDVVPATAGPDSS